MKPLLVLLAMAWALSVSSCADPLEKRSSSEVQGQLERGVTGQGRLTPLERSESDPAAEHSVPQTHP